MKTFVSPRAVQKWRSSLSPKISIGFVPTMGALHAGHLALVRRALRENDKTIVSIFVNPTQFGPQEDFQKYPRPFRKDLRLLSQIGVKLVFAPTPSSMYPDYFSVKLTRVSVSGVTKTLCGSPKARGPEHFVGVATVVAKLFNAVRPKRAYFGMKDFQQVRVIERMNQDLNFGIQIVRCPTVREKDGLAMSSRNTYLSSEERKNAPLFYRALQHGAKLLRSPHKMSLPALRQKVQRLLETVPGFKIDYIDIVDPQTMQVAVAKRRPLLLAGAIWCGKTRLIDNVLVK